jgi:hypothetical protein
VIRLSIGQRGWREKTILNVPYKVLGNSLDYRIVRQGHTSFIKGRLILNNLITV